MLRDVDVELVLREAVLVEREAVDAVERVVVALVLRDTALVERPALVVRVVLAVFVERVVLTLCVRAAVSERVAVPCERAVDPCVRAVASERVAACERVALWLRAAAVLVLPNVRLEASERCPTPLPATVR